MSGTPVQSASVKEMKKAKIFHLRAAKSVQDRQPGTKPAQLWGRNLGREVRAEIEAQLDALPVGEALTVDMKGVEVMDSSFASEVFGRLYSQLAGRVLLLTGLSEYAKDNLNVALTALDLAALIIKGARGWELLGKAGDTDRETLAALQRLKETTAPQLADALGIKLTACNQRLKKLSEAGLIARLRVSAPSGGEQYVYRWPA